MYHDCFAKRHKCTALKKMFCEDGECPFYKPQGQFDEEVKKYPELDNKEVAARHSAAIEMERLQNDRETQDK